MADIFRVRPLNEKERRGLDPSVVTFPGNGQILVCNHLNISKCSTKCCYHVDLMIILFGGEYLATLTFKLVKCEGIPGGPGGGQKPKLFGYNVVFEPGATQNDVLEYSGIKRIIEMAIEGFSCTAFCYGQTGSGKTHTLTGPPDLVIIQLFGNILTY